MNVKNNEFSIYSTISIFEQTQDL